MHFVCTLPPQDAPALADAGTSLADELAGYSGTEDVRALCMDLGFSRRLRTDLSYIFDIERDLYYSLHSEVTPDLAPAGSQLMHAMAYLSPEEAPTSACSRAGARRSKPASTAGSPAGARRRRRAHAAERPRRHAPPDARAAVDAPAAPRRVRRQPLLRRRRPRHRRQSDRDLPEIGPGGRRRARTHATSGVRAALAVGLARRGG